MGQVACVIASGPSLCEEDCVVVHASGCRTIVTNDTYRRCPWADALYAADSRWWQEHQKAIEESGFQGERWSQSGEARHKFGTQYIESANRPGLGTNGVIHYGGNSGYQSINLAYLWGAERIVLLGFDCAPAADGRAHWFGQHKRPLNGRQDFRQWAKAFTRLAADLQTHGVSVVNASRHTALTCWPRLGLAQALAPRG